MAAAVAVVVVVVVVAAVAVTTTVAVEPVEPERWGLHFSGQIGIATEAPSGSKIRI